MLTKEEVEAEKANARAIDARPIKKVAEAKQRKRKRLQVRLACDHLRSSLLAVLCTGGLLLVTYIVTCCTHSSIIGVQQGMSAWSCRTLHTDKVCWTNLQGRGRSWLLHMCARQGVLLGVPLRSAPRTLSERTGLRLPYTLPEQVRLTVARAKAEAVVGQEDLTERGQGIYTNMRCLNRCG